MKIRREVIRADDGWWVCIAPSIELKGLDILGHWNFLSDDGDVYFWAGEIGPDIAFFAQSQAEMNGGGPKYMPGDNQRDPEHRWLPWSAISVWYEPPHPVDAAYLSFRATVEGVKRLVHEVS